MKNVIFILSAFLSLTTVAQQYDSIFKPFKTYKITATDFSVDQMGNVYIATPSMQLKKINEKGDSLAVFNLSKRYGPLSYIDVNNPLKVLLYFKNFSTIISVDRLLNITNTIDLRKNNIFQVAAPATSYDGQYWLYDEQDATLKKINDKAIITQQTVDFRQLYKNLPTPHKIIDNDHLVYVYDINNGMYIFDYYGAEKQYLKKLTNWKDVHVFDKTIYGIKKDSLCKYNLTTSVYESIPLPTKNKPLKMVVAANKIYFLFKNEIKAFYNQSSKN